MTKLLAKREQHKRLQLKESFFKEVLKFCASANKIIVNRVPVTELDINLASSAERNVSPSMQQTPIPSGVSINPENVGGVDEPLDQNSSIPSNQENAADPLDQNSSIPSNQENAAEANRPINQETISETSQIPNQASITTTNNDDVVDPDVSISGLQSEATTDRNVDNIPSENNVEEPSTSQPSNMQYDIKKLAFFITVVVDYLTPSEGWGHG